VIGSSLFFAYINAMPNYNRKKENVQALKTKKRKKIAPTLPDI
jgi:hypothetical protein